METTDYQVIIAGGGPSGIAAALAAAEGGAKVLLLERSGRLGGTAVQSMVGPFLGGVNSAIQQRMLEAVGGRVADFQQMDLQFYDLLTANGVEVLLHSTVYDVIMTEDTLTGLKVLLPEGLKEFTAKAVIDATGDGYIAYRAGVPFEFGRSQDGLVQPMSVMFTIANVDPAQRVWIGSEEDARAHKVGERTWEEIVLSAGERGELPPQVGVIRLYHAATPDGNIINATQINGLSGINAADLTQAEIACRRQAYQVLAVLRKNLPGYENAVISAMPAAVGVRETRRFEGCARLEKADCTAGRSFQDAAVFDAFFPIDIHNPAGSGQAANHDSFQTGEAQQVRHYTIPYGAMVPKKINGLLFTGRCISASHEALASCRVMNIAMGLGAAAGAAAAMATQRNIQLRDVPIQELWPKLLAKPRQHF